IGLGTNGSISADTLHQLQQIAGPTRELVLVTVQAPRGWTDGVNATLAAFADSNSRSVALAQWQSAIAPHLDLLAADHIHPGSSGGHIYAAAVMAALVQLNGPPPFRPYSVWELNRRTR
ncbi:MAG TPA: acetyltransferase, partial [Microbacteriaceae bacterium]|nr:acetyltransferase [Microbacteriaceae bacterium]